MESFQNASKELYAKKDYRGVMALLETHKDSLSPDLYHYNLGLINYQTSALSLARFHFEMANQYSPFDLEIYKGIELTLKAGDLKSEERSTMLDKVSYSLLPQPLLAHLSLTLMALLAMIVLFRLGRIVQCITSIILLFTAITLFLNLYLRPAVINNGASLYVGASKIFEVSEELLGGLKVYYIESHNSEFVRVILPWNKQGYLQKKDLLKL